MNIKKYDIDAFLVLGAENKRYVTGFTGSSSMVLLLEGKGYFFTDGRYSIQSKEEVKDMFEIYILEQGESLMDAVINCLKSNNLTKLGLDGNHISYLEYKELQEGYKELEIKDIQGLVEGQRLCKTKDEIAKIKEAVRITDKTFNHCLQFLKEGMTEKEYATELDYYHQKFGATGPSFSTIVAFGDHSSLPHAMAGQRTLKKGDIIKVDFGCFYDGYCSDMTRTFFFGEPNDEELVNIHNIVREAHELQIKAVKPGIGTKEIDKIGRDYIKEKGYDGKFIHGTGHGIGLEIHESPRLNQASNVILEEGMAITIEPGIYLEGKGGVRIENDVIVTKDGYDSLNETDKSYDVYNKSNK